MISWCTSTLGIVCGRLEDLCNSVNPCFPKDQCLILQNPLQLKDSDKLQERPMDFNVTENKTSTNMVPVSILQIISKQLPLFWIVRRNIHNYLKRLFKCSSVSNCTCMKPGFLQMPQSKQHVPTDWKQRRIWKSSWISSKPYIEEIYKNVIWM